MSFGFDVENVFGGGGIGNGRIRKKGKKKKMDDMEGMLMGSLGDDFGFGERVLRPAGRANGRGGGFLDIVGMQQFGIPQIAGREPTPSGARRAKRAKVARVTGRRQPQREQSFGAIAGIEGLGRGLDVFGTRVSETARRDIEPIRKGVTRFREKRKAKGEAKETKEKVEEFTKERPRRVEGSQPPALPDFSQGGFV